MMLVSVLLLAMAAFEEPAMVRTAAPITPAEKIDEDVLRQLLTVRRVFVDRLSGGETATQMRDMIVSSLQNARLFTITENQERADAILRGSAEDLVFTDDHSSSDSVHAQANFGLGGNGTSSTRTATRGPRSQTGGMSVGDSESSRSTERKHEAVAAVLIRHPRRAAAHPSNIARRAIPRDPDIVVLIDINPVLAVGPDAAGLRLAFPANETRIGRTAPGAQHLAVGIKLENRRSGLAAIRDGSICAHLAEPVDRLTLLIGGARHGPFKSSLVSRHGARPVVDPDMVMLVDIEPAYLAKKPVVWQRLRP